MIFKSPLQILNRGSMKMEPGMFINNVQNNIRTLTMYFFTKFPMMNWKFIWAINKPYCKILNKENTIQSLPLFPGKQKGIV